MATVLKTTYAPTVSNIVDGQQIDASDVTTPLTELRDYARAGRLAASGTDTTLGVLDEKLVPTEGLFMALQGAGADEYYAIGALPVQTYIDVATTAGETLTAGEFVVLDPFNSRKAYKIDNNVTAHHLQSSLRGFAMNSASADGAVNVRLFGLISGLTGLTAGNNYWASGTPGALTGTKPYPTAGGTQINQVWAGLAMSTTTLMYYIRPVTFLKRASMNNNDELTITHGTESTTYDRQVFALAIVSGTLAERCVIGRYAGGTRDVAVQVGNGGGGNEGAQTTFKNVSGGTLDILCGVIQP